MSDDQARAMVDDVCLRMAGIAACIEDAMKQWAGTRQAWLCLLQFAEATGLETLVSSLRPMVLLLDEVQRRSELMNLGFTLSAAVRALGPDAL